MSDFLIHAARMQDAGVSTLWVSLGVAKDGMRVMHVSPDAVVTPPGLAAKFPTRTFELDGEDRALQDLQDEMAYSDDGPTSEKLEAACKAYPIGETDLREWYKDWLLCSPEPTDEDLENVHVSEEEMKRGVQRMKDMMRGMDIVRHNATAKVKP